VYSCDCENKEKCVIPNLYRLMIKMERQCHPLYGEEKRIIKKTITEISKKIEKYAVVCKRGNDCLLDINEQVAGEEKSS
jgi:ribosomal protein L31